MIASIAKAGLKSYAKLGLRGGTRLQQQLSHRIPALHRVPIQVEDWPTIYMDLRAGRAFEWFMGSPWRACPYEMAEQAVMRRFVRPGTAVFDIGANLGVHSALLSRLVGPNGSVVMFEPNPVLIPNLRRTAQSMGNGTVKHMAVGDQDGRTTLFVPTDHTCASLFDWTQNIGLKDTIQPVEVEVARLDTLIASGALPRPQFLKVDAEAAEPQIFSGALDLLDREDAPVVLYEALHNFGMDTFAATRLLLSLTRAQYRIFHVLNDGSLTAFEEKEGNLVAVPRSIAVRS
jgi:FkbM family methyltransferase